MQPHRWSRRVVGLVVAAIAASSCSSPASESAVVDSTVPTNSTDSTDSNLADAEPDETSGAEAGVDDPASGDAATLFDPNVVHTFDLQLSDEAFAILEGDPTGEEYVEGTLGFNGQTFGTVGVRHKGSIGSYIGCVDGPDQLNPSGAKTCTKISMKVDINRFAPEAEFFGQRKIQFNSMNRDDSMLHERLGYWLFREAGLVAPRSTHARVTLNGELLGLFALTEVVDGRFVRANFDDGSGNLYKGVWPFWSDFGVSPSEALIGALETNEDDADVTADMITAFATELLGASEAERPEVLARWTDVDALIDYAVVDRMIGHDDGPFHWYCNDEGCGNQNFYWYEEPEASRLHLIPWDLDGAFQNFTTPSPYTAIADGWGEITNECKPFAHEALNLLQRSGACDPLLGTLLASDALYQQKRADFLAGPFSAERVNEQLDIWIAQIGPLVEEAASTHDDAVTVEAWQAAVDEFRRGLDVSRAAG